MGFVIVDITLSAWKRSWSAGVALDGLRLLRLRSFLAALLGRGGSLAGVLTLLSDFDSTVDHKGSLGDSAALVLLLGLGAGL